MSPGQYNCPESNWESVQDLGGAHKVQGFKNILVVKDLNHLCSKDTWLTNVFQFIPWHLLTIFQICQMAITKVNVTCSFSTTLFNRTSRMSVWGESVRLGVKWQLADE